jgi:hypothetical protein
MFLDWRVRSGVSPVQKLGRLVFKNASKDAIFGQNAHPGCPLLPQLEQSHAIAVIPYVGGTVQLVHANEVCSIGLGDFEVSGVVDHLINKINAATKKNVPSNKKSGNDFGGGGNKNAFNKI